jgi:RimJ/RimL family protein N-acetyltransferase
MAPPLLTTARLTLRPLAEDDAPEVVALFAGDWEAVKQTGRMPWPVEEGAVRRWLRLHMAPASHGFLLRGRAGGDALGIAGFGGDADEAELGYCLGRRFWNRGYATEAVGAMLARAAAARLRIMNAYAFPENPASIRVLEKAGFEDLGMLLRHYPARGGLRRVRHFRMIIREERADAVPEDRPERAEGVAALPRHDDVRRSDR